MVETDEIRDWCEMFEGETDLGGVQAVTRPVRPEFNA